MSDCHFCPVESDCHYYAKPCDCVLQRKFWDSDRRAAWDAKYNAHRESNYNSNSVNEADIIATSVSQAHFDELYQLPCAEDIVDIVRQLAKEHAKLIYLNAKIRLSFLWLNGRPTHDRVYNECCVDFSCCTPSLYTTDLAVRQEKHQKLLQRKERLVNDLRARGMKDVAKPK